MQTLSPRFVQVSQNSLREQLIKNKGLDQRLVDEIASIACLTNYGQSNELNAFCGLISLAGGFSGKLWSVAETNRAVPQKLLEKSAAKVFFNTIVIIQRIRFLNKNPYIENNSSKRLRKSAQIRLALTH